MPPHTCRILLIDDDPVSRAFAAEHLHNAGYQPDEAAGGAEGIAMAMRARPDLVLCDLLMPGVDGFNVLARLRAEPATAAVPFVFITASADEGDSRVGFGLGANDYLHKPLDGDTLIRVVERCLAGAAAGRFA